MNKKIIYGILALIVLVGAVLVVTIGLKLDMKNDANTKIYVYIGKEFDNNDIEQIAKETFETDTAIVQKVEIYNEMALITIKEQNTENINEKIESLNSKINEKYGLENKKEDIVINNETKINMYSVIKPYILPMLISLIVILVYSSIIYRKLGILKNIIIYVLTVIGSQLLYASILVITRLPFNMFIIPIGLIIYAITIVVVTIIKQKQLNDYKLKQK
ncbi:export membrane protein SecF [Clostridium sp. CAG:567]|jgi:preprotein translocase subunit SecF|nr:export membrane protein SecF [Clostridium sp. CAG:567]